MHNPISFNSYCAYSCLSVCNHLGWYFTSWKITLIYKDLEKHWRCKGQKSEIQVELENEFVSVFSLATWLCWWIPVTLRYLLSHLSMNAIWLVSTMGTSSEPISTPSPANGLQRTHTSQCSYNQSRTIQNWNLTFLSTAIRFEEKYM